MEEHYETGQVRGVLHRPAASNGRGIVLTHGAGSNAQSPLLVRLARGFEENGYTVLRYDLPFRRSGAKGPPLPAHQARDREGVRQAVEAMRGMVDGAVIAAGHSYGGRQSAMAAAEDSTLANGLVLFSYPLHPPNKPEQLRTAFFGDLRVPALFVHGTRDPFGSVEEMRLHIASIPARTDLLAVEGAGHDLKRAPDLVQEIVERMLF
jgi:predicted alpha/beta-hydrolase family hydrolase